jgi:hypothetical protein
MQSTGHLPWRSRGRAAPTTRARRATGIACCAIVTASLLAGNVTAAAGRSVDTVRSSPSDLARSALQGVLHQANSQALAASVRQAHSTVAQRAAQSPNKVGSASLVLTDGLPRDRCCRSHHAARPGPDQG